MINRPEKHGGAMSFDKYDILHEQFAKEQVHPGDLKLGVTVR